MSAARLALLLLALALVACAPSRKQVREALQLASTYQDTSISCDLPDACALPSPLQELADRSAAESTPEAPRHHLVLLESGQDALLARVHAIRAARSSVDVQSYIFAEDDSGYFVLNELLSAARRGVQVRVLLDQLFSLSDTRLLAHLAAAHVNFGLKLYNPTFGEARTGPLEFAAGILCCFSRFNQRMHNKLLLVDQRIGITGGRNYQDRYYDWDPAFNYRDRDVLVTGPVTMAMAQSFEHFWADETAVPVAALRDVNPLLAAEGFAEEPAPAPRLSRADRILDLSAQADQGDIVHRRLVSRAIAVGEVDYVSDRPNKGLEDHGGHRDSTQHLRQLLSDANDSIVLQTPYLVLSRPARRLFGELHEREDAPRVTVSTNSLAATDAFPVYAISHKYKRRYLRDYGFQIYEYKPHPAEAPIDIAATGALDGDNGEPPSALGALATESARSFGSGGGSGSDPGPVPLESAGVRISLHAKSLVIDHRIGMIGTHNFDPRSDGLNTESVLVVHDAGFARALEDQILADTAPGNAWVVAKRPRSPVLPGVQYSIGKFFEYLPLFDFWPWRYATSWEYTDAEGCTPMPPDHEDFADCYEPVGDFPEVDLPLKSIYTRIITAFGAGLTPVL